MRSDRVFLRDIGHTLAAFALLIAGAAAARELTGPAYAASCRAHNAVCPPKTTTTMPTTASATTTTATTATTAATSTTATTSTTTTVPSGGAWLSGVYAGSPSNSSTFGDWRGQPIARAHAFAAGTYWSDIELSPTWLSWWAKAGDATRMIVSIPMLPKADTSTTLEAGATGAYDSHWQAAALHLVAAGMGNAILRIGWEFNQNWARWAARNDPAAYAAYWRHIVSAMRSVPGQSFRFVWCPASAYMGWDPTQAWPGDSYVDIVGLDSYDFWYNHPAATPQQRWNFLLNSASSTTPGGLSFWSNFAAAHSKPLALAEWGVVNKYASMTGPNGGGGGDDPYYIQQMYEWMGNHNVAYESYMETNAPDGDHKLEGTEFPNAASTYRSLWGS
jgi:DNA segregation ATPase FtsK/SpoIIIE-like protein